MAAAASAAAAGRALLVVDRNAFRGGMGTAPVVTTFCSLHADVRGEVKRVVQGVVDEQLHASMHLGASTICIRSSTAPWRRRIGWSRRATAGPRRSCT
jgi:hypothetical protein